MEGYCYFLISRAMAMLLGGCVAFFAMAAMTKYLSRRAKESVVLTVSTLVAAAVFGGVYCLSIVVFAFWP